MPMPTALTQATDFFIPGRNLSTDARGRRLFHDARGTAHCLRGQGAERALRERTATSDAPRIVRRYRRDPSPLVRDAARGWRTGRLDAVLAGDFDLIEG